MLLNFSIRSRIWGTILLTSLLFVSTGAMAVHISQSLGDAIHQLSQRFIPLATTLKRVQSLEPERREMARRLLPLGPNPPTPVDEALGQRVTHFSRLLADELARGAELALQHPDQETPPWQRAELAAIAREFRDLAQEELDLHALLDRSIPGLALIIPAPVEANPAAAPPPPPLPPPSGEEVAGKMNHFATHLASVSQLVEELAKGIIQRAERSRQMETLLIGVLLICLGGSILLLVFLSRGIIQQIHMARDIALEVSRDHLSVQVPQGTHEIGQFLEAMQRMVEASQHRTHMEWLLRRSEKLSLLGRLAIGMAHEINNPLANAAMSVQLLRGMVTDTPRQAEVERKLDLIDRNIGKAVAISRELLNFSRPEKIDFSPIQIHEPVEGALMLMEHKLKRIQVHRDLLTTGEIEGLYGKLEQVFLNLFQNALDAMPNGGELFINSFQEGNEMVVLVRDTGTGIPPEVLNKVFEPFFSTKDHSAGFGLGLPLCQSIVEQHYGLFDLSSTPGQGTTVTLRFPLIAKEPT